MADRIRRALPAAGHGVVVVGDAHVDGITERLAGVPMEVYRLRDVRTGRLPHPSSGQDTGDAGFGFDIRW